MMLQDTLVWSSSNDNVATVDENGIVKRVLTYDSNGNVTGQPVANATQVTITLSGYCYDASSSPNLLKPTQNTGLETLPFTATAVLDLIPVGDLPSPIDATRAFRCA